MMTPLGDVKAYFNAYLQGAICRRGWGDSPPPPSVYELWSPVLNQMIRETHFEVPFWIKLFAIRAFKSRSESNYLRYK